MIGECRSRNCGYLWDRRDGNRIGVEIKGVSTLPVRFYKTHKSEANTAKQEYVWKLALVHKPLLR